METEIIKEAEDEFRMDSKLISMIVILIAVGMILTSVGIIVFEIYDAKTSCEDLGMEYKFEIPYEHSCDGDLYLHYNNGWDFEREVNFTEFLNDLELP